MPISDPLLLESLQFILAKLAHVGSEAPSLKVYRRCFYTSKCDISLLHVENLAMKPLPNMPIDRPVERWHSEPVHSIPQFPRAVL